jgi:SSS family solute:Na+ symporter
MVYIAVIAAIVLIPSKLGGYGTIIDSVEQALAAKGGGILLRPDQYVAYSTVALGSAVAAFMYPHTLTGVFASRSAHTIRKNAMLLPLYTLMLGLLALLGYAGLATHLKLESNNDVPHSFLCFLRFTRAHEAAASAARWVSAELWASADSFFARLDGGWPGAPAS